MDLVKSLEMIEGVLAQLKLSKQEHAALDQALNIIKMNLEECFKAREMNKEAKEEVKN